MPTRPCDLLAEVLDQVGLPSALGDRLPHELSGGQRQHIGMALRPNFILGDKVVSSFDVTSQG